MDVKEKLVELTKAGHGYYYSEQYSGSDVYEAIAAHLIANGVTVQECKLGDKIYQTDGVRIYESTIGEITLTAKHTIFVTENIAFDERAIGKSIFLSYAEAEAYLPQPPKVALEDVVDIDKQTKDNNAAMRKVMGFMTEGVKQ